MLIILFGLSGSGKNFVGEILAKEAGFHFWDADLVLPPDMQLVVQQKIAITQNMRDDLTRAMIAKIESLSASYPNLVVAQALYKKCNRQMLMEAFPSAHLVWVQASAQVINERLQARHQGVGLDYATQLQANFETPDTNSLTIINESDENSVSSQIKALFFPLIKRP